MVTRKPVPSGNQPTAKPPYPTSPTSTTQQPNYDAFSPRSRTSSTSSHNTWNSGFSDDEDERQSAMPAALKVGPRNTNHQLPNSLRPGAPNASQQQTTNQSDQSNPWALEEKEPATAFSSPPQQQQQQHQQVPPLQSHNPRNPYLRMQSTGQTNHGGDSQAAWGELSAAHPPPPLAAPPPPPAPPVELPTVRTPTHDMASMTLDTRLQPKQSHQTLPQGLQPALIPQQTGVSDVSALDTQQTGISYVTALDTQHTGTSSNPWDDMDRADFNSKTPPFAEDSHPQPPSLPQTPPVPPPQNPNRWSKQKQPEEPWQASQSYQPSQAPQSYQPRQSLESQQTPYPWDLKVAPEPEHPPPSQSRQAPTPFISLNDNEPPRQPPRPTEEAPPQQPPRPTEEAPPPKPPRPVAIDVSTADATRCSGASPETPMTRAKKQRNETYQIKQINWFDVAAGPNGRMRSTPIMTQNANGPCPLLALVNALTLTTSDNVQTALVDALRSREQVSLGLLLDAVFEELARRSEITDKELPDVGDLYSFLITLHTGMNVNPRFVAPGAPHVGSVEAEIPLDHSRAKPGVFEETREMLLYSTFDIPLIHGWTPSPTSPAYAAFNRSAKTFDEALNIQFREQELEDKLNSTGLSPQDQQTYEDIHLIKDFLGTYPTQLTDDGLDIMARSLQPGQIAILFRNDHFSTLYKDPRSGALMTLVTDAGYSSHDEIVWESLVDVTGAANDLFSGDFRPVGNNSTGPQSVPSRHDGASDVWETANPADNTGNRQNQTYAPPSGPPPGRSAATDVPTSLDTPSSNTQQRSASEQEDHDLALALQLQEEEEDQSRRDAAARRHREDELSREFLDRESTANPTSPTSPSSNNNNQNRPPIPPRRSNLPAAVPDRNTAPSPALDAPYVRGADSPEDQPPTYEQAASDRPFRPAGAQPRMGNSNRQGDALGALNALQAEQRAQQMNGLTPGSQYAANSMSSASVATQDTGRPGGLGHRRRSSGFAGSAGGSLNGRVRRTQSQSVPGAYPGSQSVQASSGAGVYGDRMGGSYTGNMAHAAPGNRQSEQERCIVM